MMGISVNDIVILNLENEKNVGDNLIFSFLPRWK